MSFWWYALAWLAKPKNRSKRSLIAPLHSIFPNPPDALFDDREDTSKIGLPWFTQSRHVASPTFAFHANHEKIVYQSHAYCSRVKICNDLMSRIRENGYYKIAKQREEMNYWQIRTQINRLDIFRETMRAYNLLKEIYKSERLTSKIINKEIVLGIEALIQKKIYIRPRN